MKFDFNRVFSLLTWIIAATFFMVVAGCQRSQTSSPQADSGKQDVANRSGPTSSDMMQPEELAKALQSGDGTKVLILHVGFRVLYSQAHIPGSEFVGPGASPEGLQLLRKKVESLPRTQPIVVYCGCCPWNDCPNMNPVYAELRILGFKDVKLLYIANNFGKDWVDRGYPVEKGI
jgi:thiosulfate/3-mercaptopyruvate sulfurtransferase